MTDATEAPGRKARAKLLDEMMTALMNQRSEDVMSVLVTMMIAEVISSTRTIEKSRLVMNELCKVLLESLENTEPAVRRAAAEFRLAQQQH